MLEAASSTRSMTIDIEAICRPAPAPRCSRHRYRTPPSWSEPQSHDPFSASQNQFRASPRGGARGRDLAAATLDLIMHPSSLNFKLPRPRDQREDCILLLRSESRRVQRCSSSYALLRIPRCPTRRGCRTRRAREVDEITHSVSKRVLLHRCCRCTSAKLIQDWTKVPGQPADWQESSRKG
jgi:hypothetical protein